MKRSEIIMNHADAFQDLKEYLSEQSIGFREIYDGEQMTLHLQSMRSFKNILMIEVNIPMNKKSLGCFSLSVSLRHERISIDRLVTYHQEKKWNSADGMNWMSFFSAVMLT